MPREEGSPEAGGAIRPIVDVILRYKGTNLPIRALVDSGADMTMIPIAIGEFLTGLPFPQLGTDAGRSKGLGDKEEPIRRIDAEAIYAGRRFARSVTVGPVGRMVLGQSDFMTTFDVRFYWGHTPKWFSIEPTNPAASATARRPPANPTIRPKRKR
jgi:hypothetical protein